MQADNFDLIWTIWLDLIRFNLMVSEYAAELNQVNIISNERQVYIDFGKKVWEEDEEKSNIIHVMPS